MSERYESTQPLKRVPTGVSGLDEILRGGLLEGGVYIVRGAPGAGKTILGNELCFRHAAAGGRAAYVTLLAEMHTRMLQHLRPMSFFDESVIPDSLYYVSAFKTLEDSGLRGLVEVLRREIKSQCATLLVVDGLVAAQESSQTDRDFKKFINEVQAHAGAYDCTVLLLTSSGLNSVSAEHTMVDGVIELEDQLFDIRTERSLQIRKFRGSSFLRGRHPFRITEDGIKLFPRIEVAFASPSRNGVPQRGRSSSGIPSLDEMFGGGVPTGSTTGLIGASGVGKTTLGLQFLSQADEQQPGLYFGFYETPQGLKLKAQSLNLPFGRAVERGDVEVLWQAQRENILDELAYRLLDAVRRRNVKRLFIDGLGGFLQSATYPQRISRFFACLGNELRARGVTTIFTMETPDIVGGELRVPIAGLSALVENLVFMRFIEHRSRLNRVLSVIKVRDSVHDPRLRRFDITDRGILVGDVFPSVEGNASDREMPPGHALARSADEGS